MNIWEIRLPSPKINALTMESRIPKSTPSPRDVMIKMISFLLGRTLNLLNDIPSLLVRIIPTKDENPIPVRTGIDHIIIIPSVSWISIFSERK